MKRITPFASCKTVFLHLFTLLMTPLVAGMAAEPAPAGSKILKSKYTGESVVIDGQAEKAWNSAEPSVIDIAMNASL
ncbi:MAG: hypothetical protein RBT38_13905, partial [Bacteroidales bacterium]|nr:hypothetical protein [Bacteroidales bacterium]